jgi:hypothetical protein
MNTDQHGYSVGFVRFAGCLFLLDTGLRRYDDLMDVWVYQ